MTEANSRIDSTVSGKETMPASGLLFTIGHLTVDVLSDHVTMASSWLAKTSQALAAQIEHAPFELGIGNEAVSKVFSVTRERALSIVVRPLAALAPVTDSVWVSKVSIMTAPGATDIDVEFLAVQVDGAAHHGAPASRGGTGSRSASGC